MLVVSVDCIDMTKVLNDPMVNHNQGNDKVSNDCTNHILYWCKAPKYPRHGLKVV